MNTQNLTLKLTMLLTLVAIAAVLSINKASARPAQVDDRTLNFAAIGITKGQTVRLNSLVVGRDNIPVEVIFFDQAGRVLKQASQEIAPEHFECFDLNFDSLAVDSFGRADGRLQLRALIKYAPPDQQFPHDARVVASLEVIDNKTGKTTIALSVPEPPELPVVQR